MSELKPCPFCGSRSVFKAYNNYEDKKIRYVVCNNCRIQLQKHKAWNKGIDIVDAWNARPESAWEMFRRLNDKYGVYFREKLMKYFETNHSGYMYSCFHKLTEQEVKKIMQEIEKE